jgi:hypothetical protein
MKVAILGRRKWDWGKGDVVVIRVDDRYFVQCEQCDDQRAADEIDSVLAADLLTRRGAQLTAAGREWETEQRRLRARFEMAERRRT